RKDDQVLMAIAINFPQKLGFREELIYPSSKHAHGKIVLRRVSLLLDSCNFLYKWAEDITWSMRCFKNSCPIAALYPIYQLIRLLISVLRLPFSVSYFHLWKILATIAFPIKHLDKRRKEYKKAKGILNFICDEIDALCSNDTNHPIYSGPIFEALAVINRSEKLYNLFYPIIKRTESYSTMTDSFKNNLVHFAGRLALQPQRELQWREEMEKLMLPTHLLKENIYMETLEMVFAREHANLVKEGEQWMKTTAESFSITAALIVTIVFAAAITVPGGSNQETGLPLFRKQIAFTIFAVADAISLFSAATSLL
ncbi:ankyrin repeat-containing protein, partial [Tanacetum coccineum]